MLYEDAYKHVFNGENRLQIQDIEVMELKTNVRKIESESASEIERQQHQIKELLQRLEKAEREDTGVVYAEDEKNVSQGFIKDQNP